jgi:mRNA interferase RelE/StbE
LIHPFSERSCAICASASLGSDDPRRYGRALGGAAHGLWRYRIGAYRLICKIEDDRLIVLILAAGHRRDVYR